jgi:hypothetical protein
VLFRGQVEIEQNLAAWERGVVAQASPQARKIQTNGVTRISLLAIDSGRANKSKKAISDLDKC